MFQDFLVYVQELVRLYDSKEKKTGTGEKMKCENMAKFITASFNNVRDPPISDSSVTYVVVTSVARRLWRAT